MLNVEVLNWCGEVSTGQALKSLGLEHCLVLQLSETKLSDLVGRIFKTGQNVMCVDNRRFQQR